MVSICFFNIDASIFPDPIVPRPPALETQAANLAVPTHAIPPSRIGYLIFKSLVTRLFDKSNSAPPANFF